MSESLNNTETESMKRPTSGQIKRARLKLGLSQRQAGELVHVADSAWTRWELGHRDINLAAWELFQVKTGMIELDLTSI